MNRLECWAEIHDEEERESIVSWVKSGGFKGYSVNGPRVSVCYEGDPNDPEENSKRWGLIHLFEGYPEHGIFGHDT